MYALLLVITYGTGASTSYLTGAVIAFCILLYLLYSLGKPEKF